MLWTQLGMEAQWEQAMIQQGMDTPTEVQAAAIPQLLAGKDMSIRSQTGTGKTLAYLLPLLQRIDPNKRDVQAMIIAPTQELAMQIVRVAEGLTEGSGIRVQQLIGGAAVKRQIERLKLHPQLVVGTPGRLKELATSRKLKLHAAEMVIIDEADQVFSLGSTADVEKLLFSVPRSRQIAFFSATYPDELQALEKRWMPNGERLHLQTEEKVAATVENGYFVCAQREKLDMVRRLIRTLKPERALIFLNDAEQIENLEAKLLFEGLEVAALYGDADKLRRSTTLTGFRSGKVQVLLATDVAARGIDVAELSLVIQFDPASDAAHYVHRAGRTGRMGRSGLSLTLVTPQEAFIMDKFRKQLGIELTERKLSHGRLLLATDPDGWDPRRGEVLGESRPVRSVKNNKGAISDDARKQVSVSHAQGERRVASPSRQEKPKQRMDDRPKKTDKIKKADKNKGAPKWLKERRAEGIPQSSKKK